jgi:CO/xanthine dehydrogenase FAD-binding subunit
MSSYLRPTDLAEALGLRAEHPDHTLLAGGTDLMVAWHSGSAPEGVIDLLRLRELRGIVEEEHGLTIGATTTFAEILGSEAVRRGFPLLTAAVREIGAVQIRERATIGGNIATCSPVGDGLTALLALDAQIETASAEARRRIPVRDFIVGYRRTALLPEEILVAIHLPRLARDRRWYWRKVGSRRAQGIAKLSLAATTTLDEGGAIVDTRLAMGAVADRPRRLHEAEALLEGARPDEALARAASVAGKGEISPIDDLRSRASYRSTVAGNLLATFVRSLAR